MFTFLQEHLTLDILGGLLDLEKKGLKIYASSFFSGFSFSSHRV